MCTTDSGMLDHEGRSNPGVPGTDRKSAAPVLMPCS